MDTSWIIHSYFIRPFGIHIGKLYGIFVTIGKKLPHIESFKYDANRFEQMVSWKDIEHAIQANPDRNCRVDTLEAIPNIDVDSFPMTESKPAPTVSITPIVEHNPAPTVSITPIVEPNPVPTVSIMPIVEPNPVPTISAPILLREPVTQKQEIDPIALGIEERDVLYTGVSKRTKYQMECEEAQRLEGMLAELYKSQGGRSRGWTKSGLDLMIKPRCASGGNINELDRAKQAFTWQLVGDNKALSAFLDFVCVAKKIRIAVWFTEEKRVLVYPAADYVGIEETPSFPLYHVDSKGRMRHGFNKGSDLIRFCNSNSYVMLPPISVMNSLSKLSMDELESVAEKLGMTALDGKKNDRVAKIAMCKLHQRLG